MAEDAAESPRFLLEATTKSKSRWGFIVGRKFEIVYELSNVGNVEFDGGALAVTIAWPNGQAVTAQYRIPRSAPNTKVIINRHESGEPITTAPMAQGYGLFLARVIDIHGKQYCIESPIGIRREPPTSFYSVLAKSPEEVYEFWAMMISALGLVISAIGLVWLVVEKIMHY